MAAMSNYLENALLDHVFNGVAFTSPSLFLALFETDPTDAGGGTEVTGGSYARQTISFGAAVTGSVSNDAQVSFSDMPATTVTHAAIFDAATNGNLLVHGILSSARTTNLGDTFLFPVGNYTVTAD